MSNNHQDERNDQNRMPLADSLGHISTSAPANCGPELYHTRRKAWTSPKVNLDPTDNTRPLVTESQFTQRLEQLLSGPEDSWNNSLETIWNGLSRGNKLKHTLPLSTVVCAQFESLALLPHL
jgi:hypothetical protein